MAEAATDPLWWVGWRPVETLSAGAAAGLLAGYLRGSFGVGAAAFGLVAVGVALVSPLVRKACFVAAVGAVTTFFVVGAEVVMGAFDRLGLGADLREAAETVSALVLNAASFIGVETTGAPTKVVAGAAATVSIWSLVGAAVGGGVWAFCAHTVNRRHERVREALVDQVREAGKDVLGEDGCLHTLTHGEGSMPLVDPPKKYNVTNVLVGETSVCLHHGSTVDMVSRTVRTSDSTKEMYYDQVASVDHEEPRLRLGKADGEVVRIVTSEKPVELLEEVEEKLQKYKKNSVSEGERRGSGVAREASTNSESEDEREAGSKIETDTETDTDGETGDLGAEISKEVEDALDAFGDAVREGDGEDSVGEAGDDSTSEDDDPGTETKTDESQQDDDRGEKG